MNEKNDVLSQNEIDELLGKMGDAGETEKMSGNRVLSQPQIDKIFNVKPCDLGRADVFTNPQKQAVSNIIQILYEKCDPETNDEKSAEVFSDFLHDLRVGAHRGYSENEIATLEQTVINPILEMLEKSFKDYEEELNLCSELVAKYPHGIKPKAVKLPMPTIINTQNNPQFVQIVSPNEIIILICIETKIGDEKGFINICLPRTFIENILIASGLLFGNCPQNDSAFQKGSKGNGYVCLGNFNLKDNDQLEKGSVIVLNRLCGETVTLHDGVSGKIIAKAEVVAVDDKFGVRVTEVCK